MGGHTRDGAAISKIDKYSGLVFRGTCNTGMVASTTTIVSSELAGLENDFFNTKYYMQVLRNANSAGNAPEPELRQVTDYVSASGTFTVNAFSANVEAGDEVLLIHESLVAIGRDDNNNVISTTNVVANADGSMLERLEWIQVAIGGGATQLRVEQSKSGVVEEDSYMAFAISLMDIDTGAVASGDIDITGISVNLEKSTGGAAFSNVGITQPVFAKANGLVSVDYRFLAAEWEVGDTYKLTVSGITCTVAGDTAYVKDVIWSNLITEMLSLDTQVAAILVDTSTTLPAEHAAIQADIGDPSARTNLQSLEAMLGNPDTAGKTVYEAVKNVRETAIDGSSTPTANTLSDTLHKDGAYTYDNTTDSLEAIRDRVDTLIGTPVADVSADIAVVDANVDAILVDTGTTLPAEHAAIQADIGDPSSRTNFQSLETMLGIPDAANSNVDDILRTGYDSSGQVANEDGSIIERLEQVQEAVNRGTGTSLAANKSLVDALGSDGTTVTDAATTVLGAIGANNNNNAFDSSSVVANADGSTLERLQFIQEQVENDESTGTFSYLDAGAEQTILEQTLSTRRKINSIWLDMVNLTQNGHLKLYHKIDGSNYREFSDVAWTTAEADGLLVDGFTVNNDWKMTWTEDADEGAARNIPYNVIYVNME